MLTFRNCIITLGEVKSTASKLHVLEMRIRSATHSGSWYNDDPDSLAMELRTYLEKTGIEQPIPGARWIISPHAGYRYCGKTMAYAYASMDLDKDTLERVFILGPSHHAYFEDVVYLSGCDRLETPLGTLSVDSELINELMLRSSRFQKMRLDIDENEHSLEMQFSMLAQTLKNRGIDLEAIKLVPIMVGFSTTEGEKDVARILKPYLFDRSSAVVVSSDFCHWGTRFKYTAYTRGLEELEKCWKTNTRLATEPIKKVPIYKSIELLDKYAMQILSHPPQDCATRWDAWHKYLKLTGNTICGERPISLLLRILSLAKTDTAEFHWPSYSQSSLAIQISDSSVSYAAGIVVTRTDVS